MTRSSILPISSLIEAKKFEILVNFNPSAQPPITFPNGSRVDVDSSLALIVFRLQTPTGIQGGFTPQAIDWLDSDGRSIPAPAPFIVQRHSLDRLALLDVNVTAADVLFHLAVQVESQGVVYSSEDPTILNKEEPPSGEPPKVKAKQ